MCTSAPEDLAHYFADYEVYDGGHGVAWGQVTLACTPDTAMQALRTQAAAHQGVDVGAIRLRTICRL
ncbi:MAG: hypothetical protein QM795_04180 [Pseudoxanthomonas sp.]